MGKWYAVKTGRSPGIYQTWAECEANVKGFSGAEFKSFFTQQEAQQFIGQASSQITPISVGTDIEPNVIYTDGSFRDGKAGYAFLYNQYVVYGPVFPATNNRGELAGAIRALEMVPQRPVILKTDSQYLIKCITEYIPGWIRRFGSNPQLWKTSSGELASNVDLLIRLYNLAQNGVNFQHVYGHGGRRAPVGWEPTQGNVGNEIVDRYANMGRTIQSETIVDR